MQSINDVTIVGIVSENDLEKSTFTKNGTQRNCIRGSIKVRVDQRLQSTDPEPTTLEIQVPFFTSELKNDGNPNPVYTSLKETMEKIHSIAEVGIEKATWVRIPRARLEMNEYYKNDALVAFPRISASFINIITPNAETKPEAKFTVSMYVQGGRDEVDKDGIETGRYIVKGVMLRYDGSADVMEFIAANDKAVEFIKDNWTPGSTVDANGVLNFSAVTETREIEVAFGDPQYQTRTINVSELILRSGSNPKEGDFAFAEEDIVAGAQKRNERLAKLKAQSAAKTAATPTKGKGLDLSALGF